MIEESVCVRGCKDLFVLLWIIEMINIFTKKFRNENFCFGKIAAERWVVIFESWEIAKVNIPPQLKKPTKYSYHFRLPINLNKDGDWNWLQSKCIHSWYNDIRAIAINKDTTLFYVSNFDFFEVRYFRSIYNKKKTAPSRRLKRTKKINLSKYFKKFSQSQSNSNKLIILEKWKLSLCYFYFLRRPSFIL